MGTFPPKFDVNYIPLNLESLINSQTQRINKHYIEYIITNIWEIWKSTCLAYVRPLAQSLALEEEGGGDGGSDIN